MTSTSVQPRDAGCTPGISVQTNQERKAFDLRLPPLSLCTVRPTHTHTRTERSPLCIHAASFLNHTLCARDSNSISRPVCYRFCPRYSPAALFRLPPPHPFTTQPHAQQTHTSHPICSIPHLFFHLLTHAPLPHFCPILNPSVIVYLAFLEHCG